MLVLSPCGANLLANIGAAIKTMGPPPVLSIAVCVFKQESKELANSTFPDCWSLSNKVAATKLRVHYIVTYRLVDQMVDQHMSDWLRPTNQPKPTETITQASNSIVSDINPANFCLVLQPSWRKWLAWWVAMNELTIHRLCVQVYPGSLFYGKDFKSPKTRLILISMLAYSLG